MLHLDTFLGETDTFYQEVCTMIKLLGKLGMFAGGVLFGTAGIAILKSDGAKKKRRSKTQERSFPPVKSHEMQDPS